MVFIVVGFSNHMMTSILNTLATIAPNAAQSIGDAIEGQKQSLFKTQEELDAKEDSWLKKGWELFITAMILYFVLSFLNALVRNKLEQDDKEKRESSPKQRQMKPIKNKY